MSSHLVKQWPSEVEKFVGKTLTVLKIVTLADLNKATIGAIQGADVIIMSQTLLTSDEFWANLVALTGTDPVPTSGDGGRHFQARLDDALAVLRRRVRALQKTANERGAKSLRQAMKQDAAPQDEAEDGEELDDKAKKKKATGQAARIAARKAKDPWKLADDDVQKNWTLIKSPALHMFRFKRVIIDEYTVRAGEVEAR